MAASAGENEISDRAIRIDEKDADALFCNCFLPVIKADALLPLFYNTGGG
jgi:hypothetical protein